MNRLKRVSSRLTTLLFLGVLGWSLMLHGCQGKTKSKKGKKSSASKWREMLKKRRNRAKPVHAVTIHNGAIASLLSSTTTLTAEQQVTVVTQVNGLVRGVYGLEGRRFGRGATLARLSNPYLKIAYDRAKLEVQKYTRDLQRQQRLLKKGYVSRETAENLRFQLAQAKNKLDQAKEDIRNLRIRATISGTVTQKLINRGAWVTPQLKAFVLEDPRSLVAQVAAPERYLPRLRKGLQAFLQAEALGGKTEITGKVIRIAPSIDSKSGTVLVTIGNLKPLKPLRSGMFVTAQIVLERRSNVPLIPKVAVSYFRNKAYVFQLNDSDKPCAPSDKPVVCKAQRVYIEKGLENANWVEARSGLKPGAHIVILGQQGLRTKRKVRVVEWKKMKPPSPSS